MKSAIDSPQARPDQSLIVHLRTVAEWAKALGEPFGLGMLAYVCGLLHDLGKYSESFQKYLKDALEGKTVHRGEVPHAWAGALAILRQLGESPSTMGLADLLANIVASHHGGLTDMIADSERVMPPRIQKHLDGHPAEYRDVLASPEAAALLREVDWVGVRREFSALCRRLDNNKFALHLAVKFIFSCLVDADRSDASGLARNAVTPDWDSMERCVDARLAGFAAVPGTRRSPLDAVRATISAQCAAQADRPPGVFTLSVPTGGGKTLSSLRFAIRHARANGLKRIVYVIPYLSIIDQTAREFRLLFSENADEWLLEHHSDFLLDSDNEDDEKRYDLGTQRWDATVVVTTMVQFLESIFSNKASGLRKFHNMAQSVFVFDEVQALPVKCTHLFNGALNYLAGFGGSTCVLCSATQPALATTDRPLRLPPNPALVSLQESDRTLFRRTRLVDMTSTGLTCGQIAELAVARFSRGQSTLVVLNTKGEARKVFAALSGVSAKYFLSTDMCSAHRLDVISRMRTALAANGEGRRAPILCVSTQLIEAGVDISFDCAIRALAGFDSVIQIAGRCNRHGRSAVLGEVILVRVADEDASLSHLPEIALGKRLTARLIAENRLANPEEALATYYAYKFGDPEQKCLMDYPTGGNCPSLYDLLGDNRRARQGYADTHGKTAYPGLHSAFQTAAEHFAVIEGARLGVVVPYSNPDNPLEVQTLVEEFIETGHLLGHEFARDAREVLFRQRSRILRRLQQYTVSVYPEQENAISRIAAKVDDAFYFLSADHYDPVVGLTATQGFLSI